MALCAILWLDIIWLDVPNFGRPVISSSHIRISRNAAAPLLPGSGARFIRGDKKERIMKTKAAVSPKDASDIKLAVDKTLELGSTSDEQLLALGISPESLARNRNAIAAGIRASGIEFAA